MPEASVETSCRCGHARSSHALGGGKCHAVYTKPAAMVYCACLAFDDEDPLNAVARNEAWHELIEHVTMLDRRYSRLPRTPW